MANQRDDRYVRRAKDERGSSFTLFRAFQCAGNGFLYTLSSQRNLKIQLCFAVLAVILGFVFRVEASEWLAIVLCIAIVFATECINTALESAVDMVCSEWNELAMHAKDAAAAAVYICAIASVVVAAIIFIPKIISVFA